MLFAIASGVINLTVNSGIFQFIPVNKEIIANINIYKEYTKEFFCEVPILIAVENAFTDDNISVFKSFCDELKSIENFNSITDPFSINIMSKKNDGIAFGKLILSENITEQFILNDYLQGSFISKDMKDGCIYIYLPENKINKSSLLLTAPIYTIINKYKNKLKIHVSGVKIIEATGEEKTITDMILLSIPAFCMICIIIFLFYRNIYYSIAASLSIGFTVMIVMGFAGYAGFSINMITVLVPAVIMAIGSSYLIHFINGAFELSRRGIVIESSREVLQKVWKTILPAALTTGAAFFSLTFSSIKPVQSFGVLISLGILIFILVMLIVFSFLFRYVKIKTETNYTKKSRILFFLYRASCKNTLITLRNGIFKKKCIKFIISLKYFILLFAGIVIMLIFVIFPKIKIDMNVGSIFKAKDKVVVDMNYFDRQFNGFDTMFLTIRKKGDYSRWFFSKIENINKIVKLQEQIQAIKINSTRCNVISPINILKNIETITDGKYSLFSNDTLPGSTLRLMKGSGTITFDMLLNNDLSGINCIIKPLSETGGLVTDKDIIRLKQEILLMTKEVFDDENDIEYVVWGESVIISEVSDFIVDNQIMSVAITLILIFFILLLTYRSLLIALVGLIPLIFAIGMNIIFMYTLNIKLNASTIMTASIVTGIGVDDFIHIMNSFRQNKKSLLLLKTKDIFRGMYTTVKPVIVTSIALASCFLVFTLSGFRPISDFGILVSLSIVSSTFANIFIVPSIMLYVIKLVKKSI
ncbi:MAG: hypothetical protein A2015_01255 [Spirochaetes bacterium GWF1_31_7]|nr:MAG: hypothetical protein A2Y30_00055 [Spirochaetes bacterium GWE1_32_154]OHD44718.1 MAG: hypothetical protein A2Y29_05735 [Spirochaetes bacterium GWE2_31_10]OHD51863.1 MAG: hypothetical protein A2015_01255 [Spirochaetes bacterium GWF1_31_7]